MLTWSYTFTRFLSTLILSAFLQLYEQSIFICIKLYFHPTNSVISWWLSHYTMCLILRFGDVCHHGHHPGALLCHWQLCASEEALASRVHAGLHSVFCQILHHRCHSAGGGCSWRSATGCYYLLGLLRQGRTCFVYSIPPVFGILYAWLTWALHALQC